MLLLSLFTLVSLARLNSGSPECLSALQENPSIESRGVLGFTPTSLPAEMGVHALSRSPVLPAPSRVPLLLSVLRIQSEPEYASVF